jgi:hypothetical protein
MRKNTCLSATAMKEKQNEIWSDKGNSILSLEIEFFSFKANGDNGAIKRINRYYLHMNRQLVRYCKNRLLPKALALYRECLNRGDAFAGFNVTSKTMLCYNDNGILSLHTDVTEYDGSYCFTVRFGDVWSLNTGFPLPMSFFFPKKTNYKKRLKNFAAKEVQRLRDREFGAYYDHARKNCSKHFSPENFYITSDGLVIFYPMYSIASHAEAIPIFTIHWSEEGPMDPHSLL